MKAVCIPYSSAPAVVGLDTSYDCAKYLGHAARLREGHALRGGHRHILRLERRTPQPGFFATKDMVERNVKSWTTVSHWVLEGELHAIL